MGSRSGKGEYEYNDGRKEIGAWSGETRNGEYEYYNSRGKLTLRKVFENNKESKSEEVKEKIYYERKERNLWIDKNQTVPVKDQTVLVKDQTVTVKAQTMKVDDQIVKIKDQAKPKNRNSGCCLIF